MHEGWCKEGESVFDLDCLKKIRKKNLESFCVPVVLSYEQKSIRVNSLTNVAKFVRMKSNKIYDLKLESLSFL